MRPLPRTSWFVLLPLVVGAVACGGGGGGGGTPPPPPNQPPQLVVPSGLGGSGAQYTAIVPTGGAQQFVFTATDPDGDTLEWQCNATGDGIAAAGLDFQTPVAGGTFTLGLQAVGAPAAATVQLLVQDPRGQAAAIDLLVVRSGAPTLTAVEPTSAFVGHAQSVTLTGSAFALGGAVVPGVQFGGGAATSIHVVDETRLTCETPTGVSAGPAAVAVGHTYGTAQLGPSAFTFLTWPPVLAATDQQLDAGTTAVDAFAIERDGAIVHAAWVDGGVLRHRVSVDGGTTWASEQVLSATEIASAPQIACAGQDVVIAWIGDGIAVQAAVSADAGQTFAPAVLVNVPGIGVSVSGLTVAGSGANLCAAWVRGNPQFGNGRVEAAASGDLGATWSTAAAVADGGANQREVRLDLAGDVAVLAIVDERLGASFAGVYTVRSSDGGVTWGAAQRRSPATADVVSVGLARAGERLVVTWLRAGVLEYVASPDAGITWPTNATELRGIDQGAVTEPAVHAEGERIYAAYVTGGTAVWVTRVGALGAQPTHLQVSTGSDVPGEPQIASRGHYVFAAWRSGTVAATTARIVRCSSFDYGATFTSPTGFGDGTAPQEHPVLRIDSARLLLGWFDHRGSAVGLFTNRSNG